ncbi:cancer-related nucleoside-triphosphatase isoform X2 [Pseudophryne corroboree]|uniref:cancer-related nucleoside-triphosphatase isoform X2 n=1 Tax=Pseudophryne corroboree TaxID=495146 RepID=UPI003081C6CC
MQNNTHCSRFRRLKGPSRVRDRVEADDVTHLISGIGKTSLIQKTSEVLKSSGISIDGFYTEEVRHGGRRIGFDVVTMTGKRGNLARIGADQTSGNWECRVGRYIVDLISFEHLILPLLNVIGTSEDPVHKSVFVIDEIGKMELFSHSFTDVVPKILDSPGTVVLGTIPVPKGKTLPLVEKIRRRHDVKVFHITRENRHDLLQEIVNFIKDCCK